MYEKASKSDIEKFANQNELRKHSTESLDYINGESNKSPIGSIISNWARLYIEEYCPAVEHYIYPVPDGNKIYLDYQKERGEKTVEKNLNVDLKEYVYPRYVSREVEVRETRQFLNEKVRDVVNKAIETAELLQEAELRR